MSSIQGPDHTPVAPLSRVAPRDDVTTAKPYDLPTQASPGDRVELSQEAIEYARRLEISGQRIHDIRKQIAEGRYDTPERFDAALDKMIDALGEERGAGSEE